MSRAPRRAQLLVLLAGGLAWGQPALKPEASPAPPINGVQLIDVPLRFEGYFWADTGYMERTNAQPGQYDLQAAYLQGRFVLGANYLQRKGDWFGLAKVQLLGLVNEYAKNQYEPHTLDAFVEVGHQKWFNVQVGRFLAWEVYHRGQGIELFTAEEAGALDGPTLYWLDLTRGYQDEAGQLAVHVFPADFLGIEVAGIYGQQSNQNEFGLRPVVDFKWRGLDAAAGYEYLRQQPQTEADKVEATSHGVSGRLQYDFGVVTVGADVAWLKVDRIDIMGLVDTAKSLNKLSFGGYADLDFWRNSIGLGYHRTNQADLRGEHLSHNQAFVSYLFRLPLEGLSAKAVFGYARAHIQNIDTHTEWDNDMYSVRVRLAYDFE